MTEFLERFRTAVGGYLEDNGIIVSTSDIGDDIIIEAQGKIVQLRLIDDGNVLISTIVYFNMMGEEYVDNSAISEFNSHFLFQGGYRLMIEPTTLSLYVEECLNVRRYDAASLSNELYDFVKRSVSCTKWYIKTLKADEISSANKESIFV